MNKKIVAREWIVLLISICIGLAVVPFFIYLILGRLEYWGLFYGALIDKSDFILAWIVVLSPYIIIQLIRSIIWAKKELKN